MKVKRYKRAQRILSFYQANFRLKAPYKVIVDGTLLKSARDGQVNLREQVPKYLGDQATLFVTPCVLGELRLLGHLVGGALFIAESLDSFKCGHRGEKSAQACLLALAKRSCSVEEERLLLGSQDASLWEKVNGVAGVPLLFLRDKTLLLHPPSEHSVATAQDDVHQRIHGDDLQHQRLKSLKRSILGSDGSEAGPLRKKRRQKGANPLSCLKAKPKAAPAKAPEDKPKKPKKRRRKKATSSASSSTIDVNID